MASKMEQHLCPSLAGLDAVSLSLSLYHPTVCESFSSCILSPKSNGLSVTLFFLAALGLCCCKRASSSCGEQGLLSS